MLMAALFAISGCSGDAIRAENDRLREEVQRLEDELASADGRVAELTQQLGRMAREARTGEAAAEALIDIAGAEPFLAAITIGRLSHAVDEDMDGFADRLVLYVHPEDGRGRFLQMVGSIEVVIVAIDAEGPYTLGRKSLDPLAVRDAYRSSFMGTHYSAEVAVSPRNRDEVCQAVVLFTDGRSGEQFRAERQVRLDTPRPAESPEDAD